MAKETIDALISKVCRGNGIFRVPTYWVRRLFISIADSLKSVADNFKSADTKINAVKSDVDALDYSIGSLTEEVIADEEVIAAALCDLNSRLIKIEKAK